MDASKNDTADRKILNSPKRRIAAAAHLIITAGAYLGLYLHFGDFFRATLFYLIGYFVLHLIIRKIPNIGFYKPGSYEYWSGGNVITVHDENYVEFYGFIDMSLEIIAEVAVYGVAISILYFILPMFISYILIIAAAAIIVIKYILYPFINDIINICSRYIVGDFTAVLRDLVTIIVAALAVVSIIGAYFVFPKILPKSLNMAAELEEYYDHTPNPFYGNDLTKSKITYKHASTVCIVNHEGEMISESGLIMLGKARITFQNHLTHWSVKGVRIQHTDMRVVSPVDFKTETEIEIENYTGLAIVSAKFDKYEHGTGEGTFTITDKASGEVKFVSRFTTEYYYSFSAESGTDTDKINILLETPIDVGYFGYGKLETDIDFDKNTLKLVAFGIELQG